MLNPDGVFVGNYRTGIIGDDFNRKFYSGKKEFFPQINSLKKIVIQSKKVGDVHLFLDLHGHSILKNSFIFGPAENEFGNSKRKLNNIQLKNFHFTYGTAQNILEWVLADSSLKKIKFRQQEFIFK